MAAGNDVNIRVSEHEQTYLWGQYEDERDARVENRCV